MIQEGTQARNPDSKYHSTGVGYYLRAVEVEFRNIHSRTTYKASVCVILFFFRQRLRDLADSLNKELRHRADRSVLQRDDADRRKSGRDPSRQLDRQHLDQRAFGTEAQHGPRK